MRPVFMQRPAVLALLRLCLCLFFFAGLCLMPTHAQEERPLLSVDEPIATATPAAESPTATPSPNPTATPTVATPASRGTATASASTRRPFGRTVVVLLGGVSWSEWSRLSAPASTSTPALRSVLEQGGLGAAWLPAASGGTKAENAANGQTAVNAEDRVSDAMLHAAAILSAGRKLPAHLDLPLSLSQTLTVSENLSRDAAGYENSTAALAFARRTDRAPRAGNLVNLGWGELLQRLQRDKRDGGQERSSRLRTWPVGALGTSVHNAGGKTAALGSGETSIEPGRGARLREAAVISVDENGVVDAGQVSPQLLARDKAAPFGVRANGKAYSQVLDRVFADPQTALVALEWGDTRRAALYAAFCAPDVAAAHKQVALGRLNAFISETTARLTQSNDRLILICVPELDNLDAQLLPVVFWRPQRGGQGAVLSAARSETQGLIGLENIHAKITAQLGVKASAEYPTPAAPLDEVGAPSSSAQRLERLLALGSGLDWLSRARPSAHALWCALFIVAAALSLGALHFPGERLKLAARVGWCATMILPWLLWLAGLCVETTWRFGVGSGASWKLSFALILLACLMWFLLSATFKWFSRARLLSTRIACAWLLLTIFALWIGSFALPLNGLLQRIATDANNPAPRAGDLWALLLISATLLGLAGLTRSDVVKPPKLEVGDRTFQPEYETRRAINLRPALIWAMVVIAILGAGGWGANATAAFIALFGLGAMYLRLWLERAEREHRLRVRRVAVGAVVALGVLLLWQRGGAVFILDAILAWWPQWLASWGELWWTAAFLATLALAVGSFLSHPRQILRAYLSERFSRRAMLIPAALAAIVGILLIGPSAAPLLATFTLGAVVYEALR